MNCNAFAPFRLFLHLRTPKVNQFISSQRRAHRMRTPVHPTAPCSTMAPQECTVKQARRSHRPATRTRLSATCVLVWSSEMRRRARWRLFVLLLPVHGRRTIEDAASEEDAGAVARGAEGQRRDCVAHEAQATGRKATAVLVMTAAATPSVLCERTIVL